MDVNGIKKSTIKNRLYRGWTYEEATTIPVKREMRELHVPLYEYNGHLMSVKQISELYGINYKTLHKRLERGWSIDEAIETPICSTSNRKTSYKDLDD